MAENKAVRILHFSDVLCIWAYVSQVRADELQENFGTSISFDYRFFQVFGNVAEKLKMQWVDRGGVSGYAEHVAEVAAGFEHAEFNLNAWKQVLPASSMPAHLLLCAVRVLDKERGGDPVLPELARKIRHAFFADLVDVSQRRELLSISEQAGLNTSEVERVLDSGMAHAELSADLQLVREKNITASPTLLFNEDRQRLTGNVGYRVMEANVSELLRSSTDQQSWC
jgi:predicted DsbA family dithiol-disulfide isomerase